MTTVVYEKRFKPEADPVRDILDQCIPERLTILLDLNNVASHRIRPTTRVYVATGNVLRIVNTSAPHAIPDDAIAGCEGFTLGERNLVKQLRRALNNNPVVRRYRN